MNRLQRVCLVLAIACLTTVSAAQESHRPNIVLIVADYMGYADVTGGSDDVRTPSLASIARQGARFPNFYSASPVCGPARAALLSGYYPARVRMESNISSRHRGLSSKHNTLVRKFKEVGYRTAMVGKWHLGDTPGFTPRDHGFDAFFGFHAWTLGYHNHLTSSGEPGLQ